MVERLAERIDVIRHAAHHITRADPLEIGQGHAIDFLDDLAAQAIANALRDARHEPTLHQAEGGGGDVDAQNSGQDAADKRKIDTADLRGDAAEQLRSRLTEHARPHDIERNRAHRARNGDEQRQLIVRDIAHDLYNGALEIFSLFGRGTVAVTHMCGHASAPPLHPGRALLRKAGSSRSRDTTHMHGAAPHGCPAPRRDHHRAPRSDRRA